jgi:hypothetical protein
VRLSATSTVQKAVRSTVQATTKKSKRSKSSWSSSFLRNLDQTVLQIKTMSFHGLRYFFLHHCTKIHIQYTSYIYLQQLFPPMITPTNFHVHSDSPNKHSHAQSCMFPAVPSRNQFLHDSGPPHIQQPRTSGLACSQSHVLTFCLKTDPSSTNPLTHVVPLLFHLIQKLSQQLG